MNINILSKYKNIIIGTYIKFILDILFNRIEHVKIKTDKSSILEHFQKLESKLYNRENGLIFVLIKIKSNLHDMHKFILKKYYLKNFNLFCC